MTGLSGGCQCGAVRFRAVPSRGKAHICHCRMCQKAVGNLFASLVDADASEVIWTRGTPATFNSSAEVTRGFCSACGTPLFYGYPGGYGLCLGAFDDPAAIPLIHESGMEGRLPQVDQIGHIPNIGTTEEDMADEAPAIAASNRQHPDHDTDHWPPVSG
ncbi:GFA family protein [Flavimaricola marinus]|nr:GFA family protein [Flavimaricola marinus]